jgi:hypothetical protein
MKNNKPNIINIVFGIVALFIKEKFTNKYVKAPKSLAGYTLVSTIRKNFRFKNTVVGCYKKRGKKYFIKYWSGRVPDMKYYFLVEEFISTKNLYKLLNKYHIVNLKVAQPIELVKTPKYLFTVYEFLPGKTLSQYSNLTIARTISDILIDLQKLSNSLNQSELNLFSKRHSIVYLLTFPLITILMLIVSPEEVGIILSSAGLSLVPLADYLSKALVLSHRDLTPVNILIFKDKPYLLDCENLVLTVPGYDISYLNSLPGYKSITSILKNKFNLFPNPHLRNYITLQQSIGSKFHARPYLNYLKKNNHG